MPRFDFRCFIDRIWALFERGVVIALLADSPEQQFIELKIVAVKRIALVPVIIVFGKKA